MSHNQRYGSHHKALRRRWRLKVATGTVECARCGELIKPDEKWDLGHVDDGRPGQYAGPEHRACNRGEPAKLAWAALAAAKGSTAESLSHRAKKAARPIERWSQHWYGGFDERCPRCRELGGPCEDADGTARLISPPIGVGDETSPAVFMGRPGSSS